MTIRPYRLSGGFFDREEETEDVKRMIFLSVEGRRSEPSYFQNVNRCLIESGCRNVLIHVLKHPNDGLSSPADVYNLLEECHSLKANDQLLPTDVVDKLKVNFTEEEIAALVNDTSNLPEERRREFFGVLLKMGINLSYRKFLKRATVDDGDVFAVVIDRDCESHSREVLVEILEKCKNKSYLCCLTNPCFEFWLLLHLVDVESVLGPKELEKISQNEKISRQHTYVSKKVSDLAGHAKKISWSIFDKHYRPNLTKALEAAKSFAQTNEDVLDRVGTTMPALLKEMFVCPKCQLVLD